VSGTVVDGSSAWTGTTVAVEPSDVLAVPDAAPAIPAPPTAAPRHAAPVSNHFVLRDVSM
jgi:hypothetical protein